jgi:ribonuclease P protein component
MQSMHRLAAASDFRFLFSRGRRIESPLFRLICLKNSLPFSRFAFVVSRAVSKRAVIRNRLRRRAREWYRKRSELLGAPVDLAVIFKKEAVGATRAALYAELERTTTLFF